MQYSLFRGFGMVMDWCFRFRFGIRCSLMVGMVIVWCFSADSFVRFSMWYPSFGRLRVLVSDYC